MSQMQSSRAYQSSQKLGAGARQTEARALLEAARRMSIVPAEDTDLTEYRAALRLNWRLWTIIQSDLVSDDNVLPSELKANVMSLSIFIDKHTVSALAEPEVKKLDVLIEINRNIASGLMETPEQEVLPPQDPSDVTGGNVVA